MTQQRESGGIEKSQHYCRRKNNTNRTGAGRVDEEISGEMIVKTKKIVIKSTSGFCPVEYAYNDKLTITANSIVYEYKPYFESDNSLNVRRKWSYKTTNSIFSLVFEKIAVAVDEILSRD